MKTNPLKAYPVYYPDLQEYITFLFFMLDEFSTPRRSRNICYLNLDYAIIISLKFGQLAV